MRNFLFCIMAIALVACNDKEPENVWHYDATVAFKQSEIIVDASESNSFRIEAYYIDEPEEDLRGYFRFDVNEELSTPNWEECMAAPSFNYFKMEEAGDGTYYYDIEIFPEEIIEEVVLQLSSNPNPGNYPTDNNDNQMLTIRLRAGE